MQFSVTSYWPTAVMVGFLAILGFRNQARFVMVGFAVILDLCAAWLYQLLDNGVAPPLSSWRQDLALGFASAFPLLGTVLAAQELRKSRASILIGIGGAIAVGLILTVLMPGFQMFFGCSFSGVCP